MVVAGIDCGARTTKVVILDDSKIVAKSIVLSGFDQKEACENALNKALGEAKLKPADLTRICGTGVGRKTIHFAQDELTEVGADARGAIFFFPSCRTCIDVGAEEGRGIRCSPEGKALDFTINEKCAAGAGSFTEAMARALEVPLEQIGALSLTSDKAVPMNAQCAVFAESEVVSLLHAKTAKHDIARAIHDAIASRISSMVRKVGIEKDVVLVGGLAKNIGFVKSLKEDLAMEVLIPDDPEFVGAVGAALHAKSKL